MGLWIQNFKQALRGLRHQGWQVRFGGEHRVPDVQRELAVDGDAL